MLELADSSVHLVVTSPPYWQLKDYGNEKQIGFHDSYQEYINHLNLVWSECYRVLHPGCRLCINIGDQFARSVYYGRYKVIPIHVEIIKCCEALGMDYMGAIIWQKVTTTNTTGGASVMGSYPYPRNGIIKLDYEFILVFKKLGTPPNVSSHAKELSRLTPDEWNTYFAGHWHFNGERQDKHLAMFPEELPRRLIRMFSCVGETVLDPFLGSGTTALAAKNLGRHSVGYEINPSFVPVIKEKLGILNASMFDDATVEFVFRQDTPINLDEEIARLPYQFSDPHKLDKKIDPRARPFGSRIANGPAKADDETYRVAAVVSHTTFQLDTGAFVRLLGIAEKAPNPAEAVAFLRSLVEGKRVILRFDAVKHDDQGTLLAYVYLKNRTFVNAHLIRTGYVSVDTDRVYAFQTKFLRLVAKEHKDKTNQG